MMSLDALAEEIAAQAKAEAKAITDAAKKTAKSVKKEAEAEVADIRDSLMSRAERESAQLSTELVASSRQNNQKRELIAKAAELDATWDAVKAEVGSAKLAGRAKLIKALVADAKEAGSGMKMRPVSIDLKALEKEAKGQKLQDLEINPLHLEKLEPIDDIRGTAAYRNAVIPELVMRAVKGVL